MNQRINIAPTGKEETVTDDVIAEFEGLINIDTSAPIFDILKKFDGTLGDPAAVVETTSKKMRGPNSRRLSMADPDDDDDDEITSDDGGDFALLTSDLENTEDYDLVRAFFAYCKHQEKVLETLQEECNEAEDERRSLWNRALDKTKSTEEEGGETKEQSVVLNAGNPSTEAVDKDEDEFEDGTMESKRECRYCDRRRKEVKEDPYRYSQPDAPCVFSSVFNDDLLFRGVTSEGAWVFYNDSQRYIMHVRYLLGSSSEVTPGPNAEVTTKESGEVLVSVKVFPEQTEILLTGVVNGYKNISSAVPVDETFRSKSVEEHNKALLVPLEKLAVEGKKKSYAFLSAEDALSLCERLSLPFIDPTFPPTYPSIWRKGLDEIFLWNVPWRRPVDYLPIDEGNEVRLFRGSVLPRDPCPGEGSGFYFCSAASILAEFPLKVKELFRHPVSAEQGKRERGNHAFTVALNCGGWWRTFYLDDFLPASKKGPEFGRCENDIRKLWFPLLEKAYAKRFGSYAAIQWGDPLETLQDFTGFPTNRFDEEWDNAKEDGKSAAELFDYLEASVKAGYILCLSVPEEDPVESLGKKIGIQNAMTYYVKNCVHYGKDRLVQLLCPTLRPDWTGKWSPDSEEWKGKSELAQLCGVSKDQLIQEYIWLDWEKEVLNIFDGGGLCYSRFDYLDYRVRGVFTQGVPSIAMEVTVRKEVHAYCVLSQEDDRGWPDNSPNKELAALMLCVSKPLSKEEQQIDIVSSTDPDKPAHKLNYVLGRDASVHYTFQPSDHPYYIIPRCNKASKSFVLGLLPDQVIDNDNFVVKFVEMSGVTDVFINKPKFSVSSGLRYVKAQYQHKSSNKRGMEVREEECVLASP